MRFLGHIFCQWGAKKVGTVRSPQWHTINFKARVTHCIVLSPWVAIQASRCAWRVDMILAVKNPGVSLRPSRFVAGYPRKGGLLIRYPYLVRIMY